MSHSKIKRIYLLINIILLIIFVIGLYWNSFTMPFERDEGEYAYNAQLLSQGVLPYQDSFLLKPPLIIYVYQLAQIISPFAVWPARLLAWLATIIIVLLLALIAKKNYDTKGAIITAWLALPMLSLPHLTALTANTEKFMLLPLVGLLTLYIFKKNSNSPLTYLSAGFLFGLAVLFKPIALLTGSLIAISWLYYDWQTNHNYKATLKKLSYIIFGCLIITLLAFIPFILQPDSFKHIYEQLIVFNSYYAQATSQYIPSMFFHFVGIFIKNWWLPCLLLIASLWVKPKNWRLYSSLIIISIITIISTPIGHYYLLLMPWWILLASGTLIIFIEKIQIANRDWQRTVVFGIGIIAMTAMLWPIKQQFFLTPDQLNLWIYSYDNPFIESALVADKIKENSISDDKIFIAGSEPQIYYLSQRLSSSKFDISYPFIIDTPLRSKYQQIAITELKNDLPKLIVYSQRETSGWWNEDSPSDLKNYLDNIINTDYNIVGGFIWYSGQGWWQEPITSEREINNASLLLFKKKE